MLRQHHILEQIIAATMSGVILTDRDGCITAVNPGATVMLGLSEDQMVGRPLLEVVKAVGDPADSFDAFIARCLDTKREVDLLLADGRHLPAEKHVRRVVTSDHDLFVCWLDDLSRWRQHEDLETRSALELKQLTANIPATVFRCDYARERRITFVSPVIAALTGWQVDDFLQGRVGYTDLMAPADQQRIWSAVGEALLADRAYMVEYRLQHRNGSTIWVSESGRVALDDAGVPQYIVGSIADNTAIKAANAAFEGTVHALDRATAVVEFDLRGYVTRANPHFLALMGYELDEVVGHHHRIFCSREQVQAASYREFWERLRRGEVDTGEYLRIGKGGREVWIQATYNPIFDADGQPYKVMKFATDLSDRRQMEQELRVAIDRAEDAVEARGNFLANMSHEIRTPMNAIIGFSETVLESDLQPEQRRQIKIVVDASRSLLRLLNEILDMAKLEKGAVDLEVRDFSLSDLCEQMIASVRISAEQKGLDVRLTRTPSVPQFVRGDSLRIQQVLLNLLTNAVKFTERGSVTLRTDYRDSVLLAEVVDTGIGMPPEYLDGIFDPFTQSDASTTRQYGGSGLGTTIARQLVGLMGGTIRVRSTLGVGSVFTVELPLEIGNEVAPERREVPQLRPLRILGIDDTAPSLELLKITLERYGHEATVVSSGEAAIEVCRSQTFDVILTDLQMPGIDGFETARRIRHEESARGAWPVPIIALSAHVLEEHRRNALAAGMNGFAHKPLDPPALFAEIARVTSPGRSMAVAMEQESVPEEAVAAVGEGRREAESQVESVVNPGERVDERFEAAANDVQAGGAPKSPTDSSTSAAQPDPKRPAVRMVASGPGVNWARGISLWGDRAILSRNIAGFLEADLVGELEAALAAGGLGAVAPIAHRIRGASGNLSLDGIHHLTQQLEFAAHANERERAQSLLAMLPDAIAAVRTEIGVPAMTPSAPLPGALSERDLGAVHAAVAVLERELASSQLAPQAMGVLASLLPEDQLRPLASAVDLFDFERALAVLADLRERWPAAAEDDADVTSSRQIAAVLER